MSEEIKVSPAALNDSPMDDSPDRKAKFYSYMGEKLGEIQFKKTIWLFLLFLFVSSDIFINNVLMLFPDTTSFVGGVPNTWGVILTGIILCLMYILLDMFLD